MTNAQPQKTGFRWGKGLLFISLAANLLIVGMVAGAVYRNGGPPARHAEQPPLRDLGYGPYGRALSQDDRRDIDRAMAERSGDLNANRDEFRVQIKALLKALRTSPYDGKTVGAIIGAQQERLLQRQDIGRVLLLEQIENMSDDERSKFANRLARSLRGPAGRK